MVAPDCILRFLRLGISVVARIEYIHNLLLVPYCAQNENSVPMAMAGAYGILRRRGLLNVTSSRFAPPNIRSPVPLNRSFKNPAYAAQAITITPPASPVST